MVDRAKGLRARKPIDQMLNAEYLWSKDPSHYPYAEAMLKAAVIGGYHKTGHWLANLIFQNNNASEKPSFQTYSRQVVANASLDFKNRSVVSQDLIKLLRLRMVSSLTK